jgi:hypothetical protein
LTIFSPHPSGMRSSSTAARARLVEAKQALQQAADAVSSTIPATPASLSALASFVRELAEAGHPSQWALVTLEAAVRGGASAGRERAASGGFVAGRAPA